VYLGAKRRYINTLPFLSFLSDQYRDFSCPSSFVAKNERSLGNCRSRDFSFQETLVSRTFRSRELSFPFPTTIIHEIFRSQALYYVLAVLLFVFRKQSDGDFAMYVLLVVLRSNKKAKCITVEFPVNKLTQAYEKMNRRIGYKLKL